MKLFSYYEKKDFPSFMLKRLLIYHQQPRKKTNYNQHML
ncbi:hypothetical protein IJ22_36410 [Paenibacillus naphthalenovorans]|uniref:Uncharacterized protein n=1 Tax=Paenibacillus naphthalenovorans TaxID=162209 RepID=A0A0U2IN40_9BACL|nr:hypothetical protein IJ22_36410 [Paenibacillus naphthalenovorans]